MGSAATTLTAWEARDPLARLTEARLRVIRTLRVTSAATGSLLALKASSLVALQTIVFCVELTAYQQEQIASTIGDARTIQMVCFDGTSPIAALVESVLGLPILHSLRFTNIMMQEAVPATLTRRLPHLHLLRFLVFDNVIMPPASQDLVVKAVPTATCQLSMVNMSQNLLK